MFLHLCVSHSVHRQVSPPDKRQVPPLGRYPLLGRYTPHRYTPGRHTPLDRHTTPKEGTHPLAGTPPHHMGDTGNKRVVCILLECNLVKTQVCIPVGCVPPARKPYLPACSALGRVCSRGEGGYSEGGVCSRWCVCLLWGVSGPGGYPSMHWGTPPPVDRQTPVKT